MQMRLCTLTVAAVVTVFAAVAVAGPRPDNPPRITFEDEQPPPVTVGLIPNCGDPVPWRIVPDPRVVPPPGAVRVGDNAYVTMPDNVLHIPMVVAVKNVGRQPAGGIDGGRFVIVSQRPARRGPMTQLMRAEFRALRADETQAFTFEMRVPAGVAPGVWTVTATLQYPGTNSFTQQTADCVLTNNKLSRNLTLLW